MNELEKQIEEESNNAGLNTSFKRGANFIIEKNLMAKFGLWLRDQKQFDLTECNELKFIAVQNYWINNVYGK